ncbi:MAG: hypothetical protein M1832_005434 [Thelocarpon impressellum]|nr:MAG: hypothetical protein M1832_005434 [Thelocarpon impressellum]
MTDAASRAKTAEVVLTLIGSLLSMIGSGFILICYAVLPQKRHFRHALIINLAVADFINALNNSVSGIYKVASASEIPEGPGCVANGFIGQLSVQGTDCTILLIAVVTLATMKKMIVIPDASIAAKSFVCAIPWILPIITSFTALGLKLYHPVNGNWCWIQPQPTYLRYVLTHMWRFVVFVATTGIYVYMYIYLHRHYKQIRMLGSRNHTSHDDPPDMLAHGNLELRSRDSSHSITAFNGISATAGPRLPPSPAKQGDPERDSAVRFSKAFPTPEFGADSLTATERHIKKALLLNAYPIMYIILWIPGIANRIAEASGNPTQVLGIMQASTQYVGLANAITYGLNERVLEQLREAFHR